MCLTYCICFSRTQMLYCSDEMLKLVPKFSFPFLIQAAIKDDIVDIQGSETMHADAKSKDKQLVVSILLISIHLVIFTTHPGACGHWPLLLTVYILSFKACMLKPKS